MNDFSLYEKSKYTSSGIRFLAEETNRFPLHWHEHMEFHFILQGETNIRCSGQMFHLHKNDCLIINSNELHEIIKGTHCKAFRFKLHPSLFDQKHYIFDNLIHDDTVTALMLKTMEFAQNTDDISLYVAKGHIFHLIAYLCSNYATKVLSANALQQNNDTLQKINAIASYLHQHYASEIKMETLAEISHYSYSYFATVFKDIFGMSVTNYLLDIRINKATSLLSSTRMNITEIATASGFSDANYFARVFKKETGLSPSEYRKKYGSNSK